MDLLPPATVDDAALVSSNVAETDYTAWSAVTTYADGDRVRRVTTNVHKVFESLVGSNLNHDPLTDDGTRWLEVGATNRWAMFDAKVQSQTTRADSIVVQLGLGERIDTVAMLNVSATSARAKLTDVTDGVVYDVTADLVSTSGILDYWDWFFATIVRKTDIIFTGLPPYLNATLEVTLAEAGETVACGFLAAGLARDIGTTQYGMKLSFTDYSVKQADDFGNYVIVERAFARRNDYQLWIAKDSVDEVYRLITSYRATPVLFIGDEYYGASVVIGFVRDFGIDVAYPDISQSTLSVEGLS